MLNRFRLLYLCGFFFFLTTSLFGTARHCDFSNDGYDDLATGVRGENGGTGAVAVLYGRNGGLSATNNQLFQPNLAGIGDSLACGDFNGDGVDDLAAGAPRANVGSVVQTGAVYVLYHSSVTGRLSTTGAQIWTTGQSRDCR